MQLKCFYPNGIKNYAKSISNFKRYVLIQITVLGGLTNKNAEESPRHFGAMTYWSWAQHVGLFSAKKSVLRVIFIN